MKNHMLSIDVVQKPMFFQKPWCKTMLILETAYQQPQFARLPATLAMELAWRKVCHGQVVGVSALVSLIFWCMESTDSDRTMVFGWFWWIYWISCSRDLVLMVFTCFLDDLWDMMGGDFDQLNSLNSSSHIWLTNIEVIYIYICETASQNLTPYNHL